LKPDLTANRAASLKDAQPFLQIRSICSLLLTSRLVIVDAGHFVREEAPADYASIILDSITGGRAQEGGTAS
jgi:pimeloyl-ACP methyl ester carboxylesterase